MCFCQLDRLRGESAEENTRLRRDAERSKEEARECALRAEMRRLQAEEEAKQQALTLSEQLSELHKKHDVEVCGTAVMKQRKRLALGFTLALCSTNAVSDDTAEVSLSRILSPLVCSEGLKKESRTKLQLRINEMHFEMFYNSHCFALHFQLQLVNTSHQAELATQRKTNSELQDRLESMTSELLRLKSTMMEISTERDGLKQHLRCHIQLKTPERHRP